MWKYRFWPIPLLILSMIFGAWYYECIIKNNCTCKAISTNKNEVTPSKTSPSLFSISDGNWSWNSNTFYKHKINSPNSISQNNLLEGLDSLHKHLLENNVNSKQISVTGWYKPEEINTTSFANLGIARAQEIKNYLVSKGIPEGNIFTLGKIKENITLLPPDTLIGAIDIKISNLTDTTENKELLFEPRKVYFSSGKNEIVITEELKNYFNKAQKYLTANPNAKLQIIGHTDNSGDPSKNKTLSLKRAEYVKQQLMLQKINENQLLTLGKGQDEPIADNNTQKGKSINRRVEIKIIQ